MHFTICAGLAYGRLVCYGLCQICYIGNIYHYKFSLINWTVSKKTGLNEYGK